MNVLIEQSDLSNLSLLDSSCRQSANLALVPVFDQFGMAPPASSISYCSSGLLRGYSLQFLFAFRRDRSEAWDKAVPTYPLMDNKKIPELEFTYFSEITTILRAC